MESNTTIAFSPIIPDYSEPAVQLYETAFPEEERRDTTEWLALMQGKAQFRAQAIVADGNLFCGILTSWQFSRFTYVEHFAICQKKRNAGLGARAFCQFLQSREERHVVLEVELPETEPAKRRIAFYRRLGMEVLDTAYLQPPYRKNGKALPLLLMSTDTKESMEIIEKIKRTIHREVYGVEDMDRTK